MPMHRAKRRGNNYAGSAWRLMYVVFSVICGFKPALKGQGEMKCWMRLMRWQRIKRIERFISSAASCRISMPLYARNLLFSSHVRQLTQMRRLSGPTIVGQADQCGSLWARPAKQITGPEMEGNLLIFNLRSSSLLLQQYTKKISLKNQPAEDACM